MGVLRELRGLSQREIARRLNMSPQQVRRYESGAHRISASKMWQLCQVLDVAPGDFFVGLEGKKRMGGGAPLDAPQDDRSARQVLNLNQAFSQIDDTRVRRQVVQLTKMLIRS